VGVNPQRVTPTIIKSYFNELAPLIKHMILDDDSNMYLIGKLSGVVSNSGMPTRGWKNYWYGQHKIIESIPSDGTLINTRFDVLNNSNSFDHKDILYFIDQHKNTSFFRNVFMMTTNDLGVDNLYMGNRYTMTTLAKHFVHHLDEIVTSNPDVGNQEHLVLIVNQQLFTSNVVYLIAGVLGILILLYVGYTNPSHVPIGILLTQMELLYRKGPITKGIGSVSDSD
jgi:hypothetical protein